MKRRVHAEKNNLDWTIRLLWLPEAIRPIGLRQIYSGKVGGPTGVDMNTPLYGILLAPFIALVVGIPVMAVVLPLRYRGLMAWEVEATAWPWGKRGGPPTTMRWHVKRKGMDEVKRVVDEIAAALERGETRPQIAGTQSAT